MTPSRQARFAQLLEEHRRILYKVARGYCRHESDRADLIQEMAGQLWRGFARYDKRIRFSTWMYRVALNVAISFYRSEGRRIRDALPLDGPTLQWIVENVAAQRPAAETAHEESEELRRLRELVFALAPLDRALITLYLDGNSHAEIAEIAGLSVTNVGTKIQRIKERLQRTFETAERRDLQTRRALHTEPGDGI